MPTYDYQCQDCGYSFEEFQSMSDDSLTTCPSCSKEELKRLIGGGMGVIFKGNGFYVNDSKTTAATSKPIPAKKEPCASSASPACNSCPASKK